MKTSKLKACKLLLGIACTLYISACTSKHQKPGVKRLTISQVRQICAERSSTSPLRFSGVITLIDGKLDAVNVQDETGAVSIRPRLMPVGLIVGHAVEVAGRPAGAGADSVVEATLTDLGSDKLPAPLLISGKEAISDRFENELVSVSGVVSSGAISAMGHLMLGINAQGAYISTRVVDDRAIDLSALIDAEVTITGIAKLSTDMDGALTDFRLIAADMNSIRITRAAPDPNAVATETVKHLYALRGSAPQHKVRLTGRFRKSSDLTHLEFSDATGSVRVRQAYGVDLSRPESEEIATFAGRDGEGLFLDEARVLNRRTAPHEKGFERRPALKVLTSVNEVRRLSPERARLELPVSLDGVVTFYDQSRGVMFFADRTASIYVLTRGLARVLHVSVGDHAMLTGVTGPGDFAPVISRPNIRVIGHSPLPNPIAMNTEEIYLGQADSQWVELEGVVRRVGWEFGAPILTIGWGPHQFKARFPGPQEGLLSLLDARVRIRGACGTIFNTRRQLIGIQLYTPGIDQLSLVDALSPTASHPPVRPIDTLLKFSPDEKIGHQVHIRGSVGATHPHGPTWILDATGGALIRDHNDISLIAGDVIDVSGIPVAGLLSPELEGATLTKISSGTTPTPVRVSADEALSGNRDAQIVQVDGRLVEQFDTGTERLLLLQSGRLAFSVHGATDLPYFEKGAVLRVAGICSVIADRVAGNVVPRSFEMYLRSAADAVVLRKAPWFTPERTLRTLAITLVAIAAGAIWVLVLRRRVQVQTRVIAQKLHEVKLLQKSAEAASHAKSEFLANMSHEIRTPMNGVIGITEILLESEVTPVQKSDLTTIQSSANSLLSIINDILDFSKIEAGKLDLEAAQFDLRDAVEGSLAMLAWRAHEKNIELVCRFAPNVPRNVIGDTTRLRQIVINLVSNAIKFTEQGDVTLEVNADAGGAEQTTLHFVVQDTGIGIPAEKHSAIFAAFSQADASTTRKHGGTGLGLAISARLVEMMGGRIWVESEPGIGSKFHFTAQLGTVDPTAPPSVDTCFEKTSILVIEDHAKARQVLCETARGWGMNVVSASNGLEALEMLSEKAASGLSFQIALYDIEMGGTDRFEFIRRTLADPQLSQLRIIAMVSAANRGDLTRGSELGVCGHVTKPVRQSDLRNAIASALGQLKQSFETPPMAAPEACEPTRKLRVLLAEDNKTNQKIARRIVEKCGHSVVVVENGALALQALEREDFELVLMDIQMPEMDGFEATAAIRNMEKKTGKHQTIIALTAHAMKGDQEKCLEAGMDGYLTKPIRGEDLRQSLLRLQDALLSADEQQ